MRKIVFFFTALVLCQGRYPLLGQEAVDTPLVKFLATWGENGTGPGQFKASQAISVDPSGFLYVADTGNYRVQKLNSMGYFVAEIGGFGWEKEQFNAPVAVSARNGLDVFVADTYNHRVERYDKDLHYLASFLSSEAWPENLVFDFPLDVDLSSQGELFCLDGENRRILKLDVLGEPQLSFGDFDAGEGRLVQPSRFVVTDEGSVCVSDEGRVVVFDTYGNYLFALGEGVLGRPGGLAWMGSRFLLVADTGEKRVYAFEASGILVGSFGGGMQMFQEPVDVACWKERVYVLDRQRGAVDVFQWLHGEDTNLR